MTAPYCAGCPDHEACASGIPCEVVKGAGVPERIAKAIEDAPWCPCSDSYCVQRQTYANAARIARSFA